MTTGYHNYVEDMSTLGNWGDHLTLDAHANVNSTRIWIVESSPHYDCSQVSPIDEKPSTSDIYSGHIGESHYVSVSSNNSVSFQRLFSFLMLCCCAGSNVIVRAFWD